MARGFVSLGIWGFGARDGQKCLEGRNNFGAMTRLIGHVEALESCMQSNISMQSFFGFFDNFGGNK